MKKKLKKNLFGFILGAILVSLTTVYAASKIYATSVSIDTANISGLSSGSTLDTALTDLYKKTTSTTCPSGYKCFERKSKPEVGDYVKMTPTKTSYTTDTSKTGYTSAQTINPSELNLWRVIRVNSDGTIEMVSQYVSNEQIYFKGKIGFKNFIGYLNVLANQYQNTKYTIKARYMGYNGQTEYLTNTANTVDSTSTTAPWTSSTGSSTVESQGGGDTLYTTDTALVNEAIGTLQAATPKYPTSNKSYWLASRHYMYNTSTEWYYYGRYFSDDYDISKYMLYRYSGGFSEYSDDNNLRPIVTLKTDVSYSSALGTSDDPFVLD